MGRDGSVIENGVEKRLGAFAFAWADDRWGPIRVIFVSLTALTFLGGAILLITDVTWFWGIGLALGLFMGPTQAASRTMMARLAPHDMKAEMFGLFAFSGKITAFLGPAAYAWFTDTFHTQRAGMATIFVFILVGAALLLLVREPARG